VAVNEDQVSRHWAFSRFGVRFRNDDIAAVAEAMRGFADPVVDLFERLDAASRGDVLMDDGLHLTKAGQQRIALEVLRSWADCA
jgi:acyl-CoA thioesterase-1